jgi:hypothetical protein
MNATNGTTSPTIRRVLDEAIEKVISADNRVRIVFVSIDGDESYTSYFNECFVKLRVAIRSSGCDGGEQTETVTSVCPFWISDWLRLLKNARTRSLTSQIYVSPLMQSPGTSMTELRIYFEKSSTFTDASSLGKTGDAYPLDPFTLVRAYHLHEAHIENDLLSFRNLCIRLRPNELMVCVQIKP